MSLAATGSNWKTRMEGHWKCIGNVLEMQWKCARNATRPMRSLKVLGRARTSQYQPGRPNRTNDTEDLPSPRVYLRHSHNYLHINVRPNRIITYRLIERLEISFANFSNSLFRSDEEFRLSVSVPKWFLLKNISSNRNSSLTETVFWGGLLNVERFVYPTSSIIRLLNVTIRLDIEQRLLNTRHFVY